MNTPEAVEFADLARHLTEEHELHQATKKIVEYATKLTEAEDGGVALLGADHHLQVVAASGESVIDADHVQESLHEGPALTAARTGETCVVRDVARDGRWPLWGPIAAELGLRSAVSTCLYTGQRTLGTLNLYSREANRLDDDDVTRAQVLASHAAIAIDFIQQENGLRHAVETRNVIGQAQGLLMERYGLDARRAFEVLRRYSEDTNIKLRVVAEELVANRHLPDGR